jgi:hypothetical protein
MFLYQYLRLYWWELLSIDIDQMSLFVVFILICNVAYFFWMTENQRMPHMMHEIFMKRINEETTTNFAAKIY